MLDRRYWIIGLAFTACTAAPTGEPSPNGDPDPTIDPTPDPTDPPVVCDDVEALIGLADQVAANAHATVGAHPIVLSHGFAGFDQLGPLGYFGKAPDALRAAGFAVYVTAVTPMGATQTLRGPQLAHQIACIAKASGSAQLDLVGHSQGGLDVRWAAAQPAIRKHVASVTTISTPHRGVVVGDMASGLLPGFTDATLDAVAGLYGSVAGGPDSNSSSVRDAMTEMSSANMTAFNLLYPDVPGLAYFSWAGRSSSGMADHDHADADCIGMLANPQRNDVVRVELALTYQIDGGDGVANDGLVTVDSAKWGTFMGCLPADHLDEVGMFFADGPDAYSGFDHVVFFTQVAQALVDRGF
jgi:triacylglycerol lipase